MFTLTLTLPSVDDKYTRFLTPAMYDAVYSVATGD